MKLPTRPKPKKKERGCESMGSPWTTVAWYNKKNNETEPEMIELKRARKVHLKWTTKLTKPEECWKSQTCQRPHSLGAHKKKRDLELEFPS